MRQILVGHVLDKLAEIESETVQCVVTSPPYWGLRRYAGEQEVVWPDGSTGAYGLEPTISLYVSHSVQILSAIRRVLRGDGVVFWNLGDSYAGGKTGRSDKLEGGGLYGGKQNGWEDSMTKQRPVTDGLKPKDLCLIPFRVALAAQDDGWWVRSVIIWSKANPMPESVTDRPTTSHEYILFLTKSEKYFWDQEAVREKAEYGYRPTNGDSIYNRVGNSNSDAARTKSTTSGANPETGRNLRTVWQFPTAPFPDAHFATFPPELPKRCILAGTPEKCCAKCGKGWRRVVEKNAHFEGGSGAAGRSAEEANASGKWAGQQHGKNIKLGPVNSINTLGFRPDCDCGIWTCPKCGIVIDSTIERSTNNAKTTEKTGRGKEVSPLPKRILGKRVVGGIKDILHETVPCKMVGEKPEVNEGIYNQPEGSSPTLQTNTSNGKQSRICDGTQTCDGGGDWEESIINGDCTSQESRPIRQQIGKLGIDAEEASRFGVSEREETPSSVSALRETIRGERSCAVCAGKMIFSHYPSKPSLVLDCFAGSGTTLMVAEQLGRDYIGIEISGEYVPMIEGRLTGQGVLL